MKHFISLFTFAIAILDGQVSGQTIQQARASSEQDLRSAIAQLAQLRLKIEREKIPLAKKVAELERDAVTKRRELDRKLRLRDNRDASLIQLKDEVRENESQLDQSLRLLQDYARSWRQSSPPAEQELWKAPILDVLEKSEEGRAGQLEAFLEITSLSTKAILQASGGMIFSGNAIIPPEGSREEGLFLSLGPVLYFASDNGAAGIIERTIIGASEGRADITEKSVTRIEPSRLLPTPEKTAAMISQAIQSDSLEDITLPLDPTMGKALIMEEGELTPLEELEKGGIWIYPIIFFAGLSLLIAFFKTLQIIFISTPGGAPSLEGKYRGSFEKLRKTAHAYKGNNYETLEEILYETIIDSQVRLEKALPLIAITAATAPLLGLLGTVTGMIDVFRQITNFANPENSELARGISEALVTTKFGLITAIPSLIAHALLSRRVQGIVSAMESFSARLVHKKKSLAEEDHQPQEDQDGSDS